MCVCDPEQLLLQYCSSKYFSSIGCSSLSVNSSSIYYVLAAGRWQLAAVGRAQVLERALQIVLTDRQFGKDIFVI